VVDMLAVVPTFADLSLSSRAAAAVNAIDTYPLTVEQRCELVALAVWPTDAVLPGPVSRATRTPDIDQRPPRGRPPRTPRTPADARPPTAGVSAWGGLPTPEQRAQARELFHGGRR
jgi:hypothetical protein